MATVALLSTSPEETRKIGCILTRGLPAGSVVVLTGQLGSGKTVFVKGMAEGLNIESDITSPSYTIASLYEGDLPLSHIDLYRTGTDEELELLGFEELSETRGITAIEWGEKAASFLDESVITVSITIGEGERRTITILNIQDELKRSLEEAFPETGE